MKVVAIPASHFEALSMEELKALTGHEIGHQLRGDFHPRRGLEATNRRTQDSERLADQVGIYLSGKPEAFKTGLDKVVQSHIDGISNLGDSWLERVAKRNASRDISDRSTRIYPSLNERKKIADELATKMSTPEGRSYLEAELMRRLEAEHSKLFPHHYSRDGGVTRG